MPDIFYHPDHFGLRTVGVVDWTDEPYEFHMTGVWEDPNTQELFWADDSGCSCPSPFEDFTIREMLETGDEFALYYHLQNKLAETVDETYVSTEAAENAAGNVCTIISRIRARGSK